MVLYNISKSDKKKVVKKLSKMNKDNSFEGKKGFNDKHLYYITLDELADRIKHPMDDDSYKISAQFVKIKKGKRPEVEKHENVKVKYIACAVHPYLEFSRLERRGIKKKERDDGKIVYFIPLQFICSLLPKKYSFTESRSIELYGMDIFRCTGPINTFTIFSIFNLCTNDVYLTEKASVNDNLIRVII